MSANTGKQAKKKSGGNIFFTIIIIAAMAFAGYYVVTNYVLAAKHSIKINDKELNLRSSIAQIQDSGLVMCNVNGKVIDSFDTKVKAKEIYKETYFIGVEKSAGSAVCTGIEIRPANFTSNDQSLKDCTIYELQYTPAFHDDGVTVLVDGKDMRLASLEEWASFLKEKGFPFSDKELDGFKTGDSKVISGIKDTHKYSAKVDYESKADENNKIKYEYSFGTLTITRDVKVEYKKK